MSTEKTKGIVPPYLSVVRVERVLELAKTRTMNKVSTSIFANYGFSIADAALAVNLLKFLGAVDAEGNATAVMGKLQLETPDKRRQAFEEIVRKSYERLFTAVKEPQDLPSDELADEFKVQYGQSTRIVSSAVPVFIKLCEVAGLKEEGALRKRSLNKPRMEKKALAGNSSTIRHAQTKRLLTATETLPTGSHITHILKGKMSIAIPEEDFLLTQGEDEKSKSWRAVVQAALTFAKYLQEEKPKPDEVSGDGGS